MADDDARAYRICKLKMMEMSTKLLYYVHVTRANASNRHEINFIACAAPKCGSPARSRGEGGGTYFDASLVHLGLHTFQSEQLYGQLHDRRCHDGLGHSPLFAQHTLVENEAFPHRIQQQLFSLATIIQVTKCPTVDHHGLAIKQIAPQMIWNKADFAALARNACEANLARALRDVNLVERDVTASNSVHDEGRFR